MTTTRQRDTISQDRPPETGSAKRGADGGQTVSDTETIDVCFLLLRNFSLLSFASAIEPLRIANKVLKRKSFTYRCCTLDGLDAMASNGSFVRADCSLEDMTRVDLVAVCSSDDVERLKLTSGQKAKIQRLALKGDRVAGICTGAYVLADLGLLEDRACTIHWEYADLFKERFPGTELVDSLIQADGRILTCAGGTAAIDLMVGFIAEVHGSAVAHDVAEIALHHDRRSGEERQHTLLRADLEVVPKKLRACIELMTERVSDPLSLQEIANRLGVSPRQLQRDFHKYLNSAPLDYYSKIRLDIARQMVRRTSMRIIDVGIACGFPSGSHFSKRYRATHGLSPQQDRERRGASRNR